MSGVSEENVQCHRELYEAINAGDVEAVVALCDPSIRVRSVFAAVGGATYSGRDGVRQWLRDLDEAFGGEFRIAPQAFFDLGERTLADVVLKGRGAKSGVEVAMAATGLATWRDGLCVSHEPSEDRDAVFREAGLAEAALEPIDP